jgi:hypothetical protein
MAEFWPWIFQKGPKRGLTHQQCCPFTFPIEKKLLLTRIFTDFDTCDLTKGAEFFSQWPNFMATLPGAPVASRESSINFHVNIIGK